MLIGASVGTEDVGRATMVPVLELRRACRIHRSGGVPVTALHPTDLAVEAGQFVCVAGPSGSGKTTLLNLLGVLDSPSSGSVHLAGTDISTLSKTAAAAIRRRHIGFVFQAHNLLPVLSAFENVEYALLLRGVAAGQRRKLVGRALEMVGLAGKMERRPSQLSGGEQQRVAVARAMVVAPSVVLADEPTASLDSASGEELMRLFRQVNREERTTFLFTSHDPEVIARADRVLTLHDGRVSMDRLRTTE